MVSLAPGPRPDGGFSLIEILVTIPIVSIGLVGLVGGLTATSRVTQSTQELIVAQFGIENLLRELNSTSVADIPTDFGAGGDKANFWWDAEGVIYYEEPDESLGEGTVTVYLDEQLIPADFLSIGPMDIDGDGSVSSGTVTDFWFVPVRIDAELADEPLPSLDFLIAN